MEGGIHRPVKIISVEQLLQLITQMRLLDRHQIMTVTKLLQVNGPVGPLPLIDIPVEQ